MRHQSMAAFALTVERIWAPQVIKIGQAKLWLEVVGQEKILYIQPLLRGAGGV